MTELSLEQIAENYDLPEGVVAINGKPVTPQDVQFIRDYKGRAEREKARSTVSSLLRSAAYGLATIPGQIANVINAPAAIATLAGAPETGQALFSPAAHELQQDNSRWASNLTDQNPELRFNPNGTLQYDNLGRLIVQEGISALIPIGAGAKVVSTVGKGLGVTAKVPSAVKTAGSIATNVFLPGFSGGATGAAISAGIAGAAPPLLAAANNRLTINREADNFKKAMRTKNPTMDDLSLQAAADSYVESTFGELDNTLGYWTDAAGVALTALGALAVPAVGKAVSRNIAQTGDIVRSINPAPIARQTAPDMSAPITGEIAKTNDVPNSALIKQALINRDEPLRAISEMLGEADSTVKEGVNSLVDAVNSDRVGSLASRTQFTISTGQFDKTLSVKTPPRAVVDAARSLDASDHEALAKYMLLRHEKEFAANNNGIRTSFNEISNQNIDDFIASIEKNKPQIKSIADEATNVFRAVIDFKHKHGLVSKHQYDDMLRYKHYTPNALKEGKAPIVRRLFGSGKIQSDVRGNIKDARVEARTRQEGMGVQVGQVEHPIDLIEQTIQEAFEAVSHNNVVKNFADLFNEGTAPGTKFNKIAKDWGRVDQLGNRQVVNIASGKSTIEKTPSRNFMTYFRNGIEHGLEVKDDNLFSLLSVRSPSVPHVLRALNTVRSLAQATLTGPLAPWFASTSYAYNTLSAPMLANRHVNYTILNALFTAPITGIRGMLLDVRLGVARKIKESILKDDLLARSSNAAARKLGLPSADALADRLANGYINSFRGRFESSGAAGAHILTDSSLSKVQELLTQKIPGISPVVRGYLSVLDNIHSAHQMDLFRKAMNSNKFTDARAAAMARELFGDPSRMGEWTPIRAYSSITMYGNIAIQSIYRHLQMMSTQPAQYLSYLTAYTFASTGLLYTQLSNNPQAREEYASRTTQQKLASIPIYGEDGKPIAELNVEHNLRWLMAVAPTMMEFLGADKAEGVPEPLRGPADNFFSILGGNMLSGASMALPPQLNSAPAIAGGLAAAGLNPNALSFDSRHNTQTAATRPNQIDPRTDAALPVLDSVTSSMMARFFTVAFSGIMTPMNRATQELELAIQNGHGVRLGLENAMKTMEQHTAQRFASGPAAGVSRALLFGASADRVLSIGDENFSTLRPKIDSLTLGAETFNRMAAEALRSGNKEFVEQVYNFPPMDPRNLVLANIASEAIKIQNKQYNQAYNILRAEMDRTRANSLMSTNEKTTKLNDYVMKYREVTKQNLLWIHHLEQHIAQQIGQDDFEIEDINWADR